MCLEIVTQPIGTKILTKAEQVLRDHFLIHLFQQWVGKENGLCKLGKYLQVGILGIILHLERVFSFAM